MFEIRVCPSSHHIFRQEPHACLTEPRPKQVKLYRVFEIFLCLSFQFIACREPPLFLQFCQSASKVFSTRKANTFLFGSSSSCSLRNFACYVFHFRLYVLFLSIFCLSSSSIMHCLLRKYMFYFYIYSVSVPMHLLFEHPLFFKSRKRETFFLEP